MYGGMQGKASLFIAPVVHRTLVSRSGGLRCTKRNKNGVRLGERHRTRATMALPSSESILRIRFPESVEVATSLLSSAPHPLPPAYLPLLQAFMQTSAGSRGLFVSMLSDPSIDICARGGEEFSALISAIRTESGDVADLVVKNVVMPTAMAVRYARLGEDVLRESAEVTRGRAVRVAGEWGGLEGVGRDMVRELRGEGGRFEGFAKRWGYDEREREAMIETLRETLGEGVGEMQGV